MTDRYRRAAAGDDLLLLERDALTDLGVLADPERSILAVIQAGPVVGRSAIKARSARSAGMGFGSTTF